MCCSHVQDTENKTFGRTKMCIKTESPITDLHSLVEQDETRKTIHGIHLYEDSQVQILINSHVRGQQTTPNQ